MMKGSLILHKRRVCSLYVATMSPIYNPLCLPANIALPIHHALDIQFFFLHIFLFTVINGTKFYKQKIGLVWLSGPIEACNISRRGTYLIFVIFFSIYAIFGFIFLHTKVRKSRQNRFRDKQRKSRQNQLFNKTA